MACERLYRSTKKGQGGLAVLALFISTLTINFSARDATAAPGDHAAGLGLGQVVLMGEFNNTFSDSLGFQAMYSYDASDMFGLLAMAFMSSHEDNLAGGTNSLSIKGLMPNLKANLAYIDKLTVYSFGGFGLFQVGQTVGDREGSVLTFGLDIGAGFTLAIEEHFRFGTQLAFTNVFTKTDSSTATSSRPGLAIGGNYMNLFLTVFYVF